MKSPLNHTTTLPVAFQKRVHHVMLTDPTFDRLTVTFAPTADPTPEPPHWERLIVRPVQVKGEARWQFAYFTAKQDITKNYRAPEATAALIAVFELPIRSVTVQNATESWSMQVGKRGTPVLHHQLRATSLAAESLKGSIEPTARLLHDRVKNVLIPANHPDPLLYAIGVADAEGHIRPAMHAKYAQVNNFLSLLDQQIDVLSDITDRPIHVLDAGCGAAYLSLAAYHYLTARRGLSATLTGIDYNADLIAKDSRLAEALGYGAACFTTAAIADYRPNPLPDVLIALHACDTASDDALALGIRSGARLILCAPCCHAQLRRELTPVALFQPIMRHGILERQFASLLTDAFRALILRLAGYKTDVVEFVAPEHTDKNLLIRAVKRDSPADSDKSAQAEYEALKQFWGVTPYLEKLLAAK